MCIDLSFDNKGEVAIMTNNFDNIDLSWYQDPAVFEQEQAHLFQKCPIYVGHELMVPSAGDYHVLSRHANAEVLTHTKNGIHCISNICRHHQAMLLEGDGNTDTIICPLHHWMYNLEGKMLKAPLFNNPPCLHLDTTEIHNWHKLLFKNAMPAALGRSAPHMQDVLRMEDYRHYRSMSEVYEMNWKVFMEVFIDNYHVPFVHPGLRSFVDWRSQFWEIGDWYSGQFVKINPNFASKAVAHYQEYGALVAEAFAGQKPDFGAIWVALYPNLMFERYPGMIIISTIDPIDAERCVNHLDFFHPKTVVERHPEFPAIAQRAYLETASEDKTIALSMQKGRTALQTRADTSINPHHPLMEAGLPSFYTYLRQALAG